MDKGSFALVTAFVKAIYQAFPIGKDDTHVALVTVARTSTVVFDFNAFFTVKDLDRAFGKVALSRGPLNLYQGFMAAQTNLFAVSSRKGIPNLLIVLANGKPRGAYITASANARISGILVFTVGTSASVNQQILTATASTPQFTLAAASASMLMTSLQAIADKVGQGKVILLIT